MYLSIIEVTALKNFELLLKFENNEEKLFDVKPYLGIGQFSELKDISLFKSVRISFDTIEWANGLDLDPVMLYEKGVVISSVNNLKTA